MPQLVKGGKWVFGWAVVRPDGSIPVPPEAWDEYGYQAGEQAIVIAGSRTSGGCSVATPRLMTKSTLWPNLERRSLGRGEIGEGRIIAPPEAKLQPGDRLIVPGFQGGNQRFL